MNLQGCIFIARLKLMALKLKSIILTKSQANRLLTFLNRQSCNFTISIVKVLFKIAKTCKPETIKLLFPDTRSDLVLVGFRTMKINVYNYNYENCYDIKN